MEDKEKIHQILSSLWKNDDSVGKTYYNQALQDVQTAIDLQEEPQVKKLAGLQHVNDTCKENGNSLTQEPVSEDLKTELNKYIKGHFTIDTEQLDRFGIEEKDYMYSMDKSDMLALVEYFTNRQKEQFEKNRLAACDAQTNEEAGVNTIDDCVKRIMAIAKKNDMKIEINISYKEDE